MILDKFSKDELKQIVQESDSFREVLLKCGYTTYGQNDITLKKRLQEWEINTDHFTGRVRNKIARTPENVFMLNSTCSQAVLRSFYLKGNYSPYKCAICGQEPIWNEKPLTLILDHINGHNHDNRLENLRWICPNCDHQLPTFGSKNYVQKREFNLPTAPVKEKSKSSRPSPTSVAVEQIDPQTQQVIARYDSISAATHATGIRHIAISSKYPSTRRAGGFQWRRV